MVSVGQICNPSFIQNIDHRFLGFDPNRVRGTPRKSRGQPGHFPGTRWLRVRRSLQSLRASMPGGQARTFESPRLVRAAM